ncbi:MAG: YbaB/EbfC family nucleoid-associated protein [Chlamydiota bacterium]|jgi:DNA-binding YbaB/EbfC family protein
MGTGYSKQKKQAKLMQQQFAHLQEELKSKSFTAASSGDLVSVTLNGDGDLLKIVINPSCVDPEDVEGLQDLIIQAHQAAGEKVKKEAMPDLGALSGGLPPGFSF